MLPSPKRRLHGIFLQRGYSPVQDHFRNRAAVQGYPCRQEAPQLRDVSETGLLQISELVVSQ
jgi:hypothetical protein